MSIATFSRGCGIHWNGPPLGLLACKGHLCERVAQAIRRYHDRHPDFARIAYSWMVCPGCGRRHTGRGWGVRQAANGTKRGNDEWHSVMILMGEGERLTDAAKLTVLDLGHEHKLFYGQTRLVPHSWFKSTKCPGPHVRIWLGDGAPSPRPPIPKPEPPVTVGGIRVPALIRNTRSNAVHYIDEHAAHRIYEKPDRMALEAQMGPTAAVSEELYLRILNAAPKRTKRT